MNKFLLFLCLVIFSPILRSEILVLECSSLEPNFKFNHVIRIDTQKKELFNSVNGKTYYVYISPEEIRWADDVPDSVLVNYSIDRYTGIFQKKYSSQPKFRPPIELMFDSRCDSVKNKRF